MALNNSKLQTSVSNLLQTHNSVYNISFVHTNYEMATVGIFIV